MNDLNRQSENPRGIALFVFIVLILSAIIPGIILALATTKIP